MRVFVQSAIVLLCCIHLLLGLPCRASAADTEWLFTGGDPLATSFRQIRHAGRLFGYSIEHLKTSRYHEVGDWYQKAYAADVDRDGDAEILFSADRPGELWIEQDVVCWGAEEPEDQNLSVLGEGELLCPYVDPDDGHLRLLCWQRRPAYVPSSSSPEALFLFNYPREGSSTEPLRFLNALRAAAARESLSASVRLVALDPSGAAETILELDGRFQPLIAAVMQHREHAIAFITFNSGFQVKRFLYDLLLTDRMEPGASGLPRVAEAPETGFRGVLAVDVTARRVLWSLSLGAYPKQLIVADLNHDGEQELLVATRAPTNGVDSGGTTDHGAAYVLCLDMLGNEVWRRRVCGHYVGIQIAVADVASSPGLEVVAAVSSPATTEVGRLETLSSTGRPIASSQSLGGVSGLILADVHDDEKAEIICGGSDGRAWVLDGNLTEVAAVQDTAHSHWQFRRLLPLAACDLDADGRVEIVATSYAWSVRGWAPIAEEHRTASESQRTSVVILDTDLHEEHRAALPIESSYVYRGGSRPGDCMLVDINGDQWNDIVLLHSSRFIALTFGPAAAKRAAVGAAN